MKSLLIIGAEGISGNRFCQALETAGCRATFADMDDGSWGNFDPARTEGIVIYLNATRGDAFRLIYRIRRSVPKIPIIAVAPFHDEEVERHAHRSGATLVLSDPVNTDDFASFIAAWNAGTAAADAPQTLIGGRDSRRRSVRLHVCAQ